MTNLIKTIPILLTGLLLCEGMYHLGIEVNDINIVMLLAIFIISATTDGYWYGLGASLAGVLIHDYLITNPRMGFSLTLGFPITFCLMLLITIVTGNITNHLKKQAETAQEKERQAELLYQINRDLLSSRGKEAIIQTTLDFLQHYLEHSSLLRIIEDDSQKTYFIQDDDDFQKADLLSQQNQYLVEQYHIKDDDTEYGFLTVSLKKGPLLKNEQHFLHLLLSQTAQALRIEVLSTKQQQAVVAAETEKARTSFLRGISHDLRTPLTSIMGASATFLENSAEIPAATQLQLIRDIYSDARWLLNMVENILSVTRIHHIEIHKTEEVAEEVVGGAAALHRKQYEDADITIRPNDTVLFVSMDAILITQVILNLLANSRRHSGGKDIKNTIEIRDKADFIEFIISDNGPGINEASFRNLFKISEGPTGHSEDAVRGHGIGLSICKTIVEAHGGWIKAINLPECGAQFTFALPKIKETPNGE